HRLLIFARRVGISDDTASSLNVRHTAFDDHRAQRDAGIEITRKIQVQDAAGVNAAASFFQLLDDFHSTDFRSAGNGTSGEASHERVEAIDVLAQVAAQARNDVHHMRVALDGHQLFNAHRTIVADAAKVVAA